MPGPDASSTRLYPVDYLSHTEQLYLDTVVPPDRRTEQAVALFRDKYGEKLINPITSDKGPSIEPYDLRRYLGNKRLVPAAQIYQSLDSDSLTKPSAAWYAAQGAEFLPRLIRSTGEVIPPGRFIAAAEHMTEKTDFNAESHISLTMLAQGCRMVAKAQQAGIPDQIVSVNAPDAMLMHPECGERIAEIVEITGIPLRQIVLEIMEHKRLRPASLAVLDHFAGSGMNIAIDDFPEEQARANAHILRDAGIPIETVKFSGRELKRIQQSDHGELRHKIALAVKKCAPQTLVFEGFDNGLPMEVIDLLHDTRARMELENLAWLIEGRVAQRAVPYRSDAARTVAGAAT